MSNSNTTKMGGLLRSTGWRAIAVAVAAMVMPVQASAQTSGRVTMRGQAPAQSSEVQDSGNQNRSYENRAERRAERVENRGEWRSQRIERRSDGAADQIRQRGDWRANRAEQNGNNWRAQRIEQRSNDAARQVENRGDWRANRVEDRTERRADRIRNGETWRSQDGRTWRDANRDRSSGDWRDSNRTYRDSSRWRDNDNRNWDNRNWRDGDRSRWDRNRWSNQRQWDRRWRSNNRYDWYGYRSHNRDRYRLGRYYSPYSGYSYRRLGIGFSLGSLFYSSRYWIDDPWQYRLPDVYDPYRWVRYYDDVLLVNIYTGEVVDVIQNIFW